MSAKKPSGFLKVFFPFLFSFMVTFILFAAFIIFEFSHYEVPVLKNEFLLLFFSFMAIYSTVTFVQVYFLYGRMKAVTRYARDVSRGHRAAALEEDASGLFNGLISSVDQMSARLEEKAKTSEQEKKQILAILQSMTEGVIVTDTSGRVTLLNSVLSGILEVPADGVLGRYFWEIFRDPEINKSLQAALTDQMALKKEHTMLLSDSVYQIHISPVFSGKNFLGIAAVFYDLTKIKELERTRSEFVANVSHELKTPLTSIIGFVETLREGAIEDPEHRGKFIQIIEEHSRKLSLLIEDLLLLSKLESGKDRMKKEVVDLGKVLGKISELLKKNLEAKKIQLEVKLRPEPFLVYADSLLVEQALTNLLDNAIKYNKPHGRISVSASQNMHGATVRVKDSGIGIPEQELSRVFERFYRVDKSRSRESGGTGLGLSIVKHIIEKHAGTVEVNSAENKGTTFTILLPSH